MGVAGHALAPPPLRLTPRTPARRSLRRASAFTVSLSALTLVINLATGVIAARALGASGRGLLAASLAATNFFGWLGSVGGRQSLGYRIAGDQRESALLLSSWLLILPGMLALTYTIAELLLPVLFAAQSQSALETARLFVFAAGGVLSFEVLSGSVLGHQEFMRWNLYKFLQPILLVAGYLGFLLTHDFTTSTALIANAVSLTLPSVLLGIDQAWRYGLIKPQRIVARSLLSFGLRSHLGSLSAQVNGRLDVLIAPAVLTASAIGYYAVAVNVAGMILAVTGTLNYLTLPAARAAGKDAARTVRSGVLTSLLIGLAGGLFLLATGSFLLPLVYGGQFRRSVGEMLVLLPGVILLSPANVLVAGIEALGRPGLGSLPQGLSVAITVVGLWLFLAAGGGMAAAIVSSIAYSTTFFAALIVFRRVAAAHALTQTAASREADRQPSEIALTLEG